MKNRLLNHIQFLRGLSVLLVFFYHLKLNYFEYGFLGVDIFFVISGYVITSRIYDEFQKTKRINILNFYLKRFQRIYPVLILVMSFTLILIIFFQPLDLFLNNSKFLYFDPYLSICPKDTCYVFNVDKNLITHRDESHLTVEGSIMMKNEFSSFYNLKLR